MTKQASRANIAVKAYEVRPDGTVVIVIGQPVNTTNTNPWDEVLKHELH